MNDNIKVKHRILLVEDNPADISLTKEVLNKIEIITELAVVHNGVETLHFLDKKTRPDLIFLDLNLPKMTGLEVLKEIKEHEEYRRIPVIILTISANEEDLKKAYDLHANCYINKPLEIDRFYEIMKCVTDFFFKTVKLSNY